MQHSVESDGFEDLKVVQVSATEWRVSGRPFEEQSPAAFWGLVCQCGEAFSVIRPGRFPEWRSYCSFDRALASFADYSD